MQRQGFQHIPSDDPASHRTHVRQNQRQTGFELLGLGPEQPTLSCMRRREQQATPGADSVCGVGCVEGGEEV